MSLSFPPRSSFLLFFTFLCWSSETIQAKGSSSLIKLSAQLDLNLDEETQLGVYDLSLELRLETPGNSASYKEEIVVIDDRGDDYYATYARHYAKLRLGTFHYRLTPIGGSQKQSINKSGPLVAIAETHRSWDLNGQTEFELAPRIRIPIARKSTLFLYPAPKDSLEITAFLKKRKNGKAFNLSELNYSHWLDDLIERGGNFSLSRSESNGFGVNYGIRPVSYRLEQKD